MYCITCGYAVNVYDAVRFGTVQWHRSVLRYKQTSVFTEIHSCRDLALSIGGLLKTFLRYKWTNIHTANIYRHTNYFGVLKWCWQCFTASVFVSLCGPQSPERSIKGDRTVASGEMDKLGDQCIGCEEKAGREGGRGVSRHAAPRAMTSKALPPSERTCC